MPPPRRKLQATVEDTLTPPDHINEGQLIARVVKAMGQNLYSVQTSDSNNLLVELEAKFRSTIWLKRGGYVLVDKTTLASRDNKIDGEIINVVRDEKAWRKASYWPANFAKQSRPIDGSDEEESRVGQMPPSSEDDTDVDGDS